MAAACAPTADEIQKKATELTNLREDLRVRGVFLHVHFLFACDCWSLENQIEWKQEANNAHVCSHSLNMQNKLLSLQTEIRKTMDDSEAKQEGKLGRIGPHNI